MRFCGALFIVIVVAACACADFSYSTTTKMSGGMMGAAGAAGGRPGAGIGNQTTRHFLKGDKMKMDTGTFATIMDFDSQTFTHLDHTTRTYTVSAFKDLASKAGATGAEFKIDVQDTGQRKNINGHDARLYIFTMEVDMPQARRPGGGEAKMRVTDDVWLANDVPGAQEIRAFYAKNAQRGLWTAMMGLRAASEPGMAKSLEEVRKKIMSLNGVPVLQVMKMGASGAAANQEMARARAQLEEMKKKGGQEGKMAADMLARMGSGSMMEITIESSNFSAASIAASEFAVPAGYQKKAQ